MRAGAGRVRRAAVGGRGVRKLPVRGLVRSGAGRRVGWGRVGAGALLVLAILAITDDRNQPPKSNLAPLVDVDGIAPGVLLVTVPFRDAWLLVAVNESSRTRTVIARQPGKTRRVTFEVEAGYGRMAFIDPRAWTVIDVS